MEVWALEPMALRTSCRSPEPRSLNDVTAARRFYEAKFVKGTHRSPAGGCPESSTSSSASCSRCVLNFELIKTKIQPIDVTPHPFERGGITDARLIP